MFEMCNGENQRESESITIRSGRTAGLAVNFSVAATCDEASFKMFQHKAKPARERIGQPGVKLFSGVRIGRGC